MDINDLKYWIPCSVQLPSGENNEIPCLVTCREWNIFTGKWGDKEIRILSYSTKFNEWNTKSDIIVEAWMNLPNLYQG